MKFRGKKLKQQLKSGEITKEEFVNEMQKLYKDLKII